MPYNVPIVPNLSPGLGEICGQGYKPTWESEANCQLFATSGTRTHNLRITGMMHLSTAPHSHIFMSKYIVALDGWWLIHEIHLKTSFDLEGNIWPGLTYSIVGSMHGLFNEISTIKYSEITIPIIPIISSSSFKHLSYASYSSCFKLDASIDK